MDNYCKACRKKIEPSLLDMIEQMRDRVWDLEENLKRISKLKAPPVHSNDPEYDSWDDYDQQLYDAIFDKWNKLDDYYNACEKKLDNLTETMERIGK